MQAAFRHSLAVGIKFAAQDHGLLRFGAVQKSSEFEVDDGAFFKKSGSRLAAFAVALWFGCSNISF
jgi:hypothetical protein